MKVQFKFRDGIDADGRRRVLGALGSHGAKGVRRLFPDERDNELAYIYIIEVSDEDAGRRLLSLLNRSRAVEFAEWEARRKLIKPRRPA